MIRSIFLSAVVVCTQASIAQAGQHRISEPAAGLTAQIDGFHGVPGTGKTVTSRVGQLSGQKSD